MKKILAFLMVALFATLSVFAKERKVAVQTYTCYSYTLEDVCKMLNVLEVDKIELCEGHKIGGKYPNVRCNRKMKPEHLQYVKDMFKKYNIKVVSSGVYYVKSEQDVIDICNFVKEFGAEYVSTESTPEMIKLWRKHMGNMKLTIHNHHKPPYVDFNHVAKIIAPYDNVGACPDNGGWTRAGFDSVEGLKALNGKIFTIHLKDQEKLGDPKSNAKIYGTGCVNLKGMLAELDKQGFDGYFIIEHGNYDDKYQVIKRDVEFLKNN